MKTINFGLILFFIFSIFSNLSFSQCAPAAPAVAACSGGNGAGSNGVNINGGQTFWFNGGPTTWASGINLNGGTFRVCGNLTLSSISFNSGTIIVESGGTLTINGGGDLFLNGNSSICVRGTLNLNRNLRMQNSNNTIWSVGSSAKFNISGQLEINSASSLVRLNQGGLTASSIVVQGSASAGAICMMVGSCFTFNGGGNSIVNNFTNAWSFSGAGRGAVSFNGNAVLNNAFTSSSNVVICRNVGATTSGGGGWGAATLTVNPCPNCGVALPIELLYFNANECSNNICFSWETATELNNDYFEIEFSENGLDFIPIKKLKGAGTSLTNNSYKETISTTELSLNSEILYFRLKQVDYNGTTSYSEIASVTNTALEKTAFIYPNPFSEEITIMTKNSCELELVNNGFTILNKNVSANTKTIIGTKNFSSGVYFLLIRDSEGTIIQKEKLIKE